MGLFGLGGPELAVIAGVAVLIFGKNPFSADTSCQALFGIGTNLASQCRSQQNPRPWKGGWQGR